MHFSAIFGLDCSPFVLFNVVNRYVASCDAGHTRSSISDFLCSVARANCFALAITKHLCCNNVFSLSVARLLLLLLFTGDSEDEDEDNETEEKESRKTSLRKKSGTSNSARRSTRNQRRVSSSSEPSEDDDEGVSQSTNQRVSGNKRNAKQVLSSSDESGLNMSKGSSPKSRALRDRFPEPNKSRRGNVKRQTQGRGGNRHRLEEGWQSDGGNGKNNGGKQKKAVLKNR